MAHGGQGIKPRGKHGVLAPPEDHEAAVKMGRRKDSEKGDIFPKKSGPRERKEAWWYASVIPSLWEGYGHT